MGGIEESLFANCNKVFILVLALTVSVTYNVTSHVKETTHISSRHMLPFLCTIQFESFEWSGVEYEASPDPTGTRLDSSKPRTKTRSLDSTQLNSWAMSD